MVALVGGLVAALLMQRLTSARGILSATIAASGIATAALCAILIELRSDQPAVLPFLPVLAFAVLHVAVAIPRGRPWTHPLVTATAITAMVAVGAVALVSGRVDPFDLVTATVGIALILRGAVWMLRTPALSSWPAVGPGLAVLLVLSLLADGLTQLWPVIAANYGKVWWWLWIAIAGIILIAIAATYERQLRFAKSMIRTVASLR